ncbi:MAG: dephospho-CoA kinase [Betaproteobacteria bacterium]|nr:dephospho-CoA kinase [Betaproteobacteria bacterium]
MNAVALTGGIASGKSTVAGLLQAHRVPLLDTDSVAADLSRPGGRAIPALRDAFGAECLTVDGALDRPRMREQAFVDDNARLRLESILHPLIREEVEVFISSHLEERCAVAIPLFFESLGYRARFAEVVAVDCARSIQHERLVRDRGMAPALAEAILNVQVPRSIRLQLADRVLSNNTDLETLAIQVERWVGAWR